MVTKGLNRLYWAFLFITITFRFRGYDVLPDTLGFIILFTGLQILNDESTYFQTAKKYTLPMIPISILNFYELKVLGTSTNIGFWGPFSIVMGVITTLITLLIVYNVFMGVKEIAEKTDNNFFALQTVELWTQFKFLQFGWLLLYVARIIPGIALLLTIALVIATIVITVSILKFFKNFEKNLFTESQLEL